MLYSLEQKNLQTENFVFESQNYVKDMIIVAPKLNDWRKLVLGKQSN